MGKELAPIALFVYNRPRHTRQTVESLQRNNLAEESDLIVFSDGPKTESDVREVIDVRDYLKTIKGFKTVNLIERELNLGLAQSIMSGVTDVINKYGRVIVMEDDLVTSPYFLSFMNDALELYEADKRVMHISGFMFQLKKSVPETFFLRFPNSWGWATWKRAWDNLCCDTLVLLESIKQKGIDKFTVNRRLHSYDLLNMQHQGEVDSWAVLWYSSIFLNDGTVLYPGKTLVKNIGLDGSGVHCSSQSMRTVMSCERIKVCRMPVSENLNILDTVLSAREGSFLERITAAIKRYLANLREGKLTIR